MTSESQKPDFADFYRKYADFQILVNLSLRIMKGNDYYNINGKLQVDSTNIFEQRAKTNISRQVSPGGIITHYLQL